MSFDQIADMLTRIRNAQRSHKADVVVPASKLKLAVAKSLYGENYINDVSVFSDGNKNFLKIKLKYSNNVPVIKEINRISKQGQRIYVGKNAIPVVRNGFGMAIISTSKGVLTNKQAREEGIGGELICEVW